MDRIDALSAGLDESERALLRMAGWFHDVGYLYGYDNHEDRGMLIAQEYLEKAALSAAQIAIVTHSIEATKMSLQPRNQLEEIIKDADIGFGVTEAFFETGPLLRKEWAVQLDKVYSNLEWETLQYDFLLSVQFYSAAAKVSYSPVLEQNILKQKKILDNLTL